MRKMTRAELIPMVKPSILITEKALFRRRFLKAMVR
jgi:hypothetical protein